MAAEADLLVAFETHSPDDIRKLLSQGVSAVEPINGKRPIDYLIEGYLRSSRFAECLRTLLDAGAEIGDPTLEAILLDDPSALEACLTPEKVGSRLDVVTAYTSCRGVTPLHLCAEFNSVRCGRTLIDAGADVDAHSSIDVEGFGGQTPIFHAVNSNLNYCRPMMEMLVEAGASLDVRAPMLLWGETFPWETIVFDQTPLSFAQCGLFGQFHRDERDVYSNIAFLYSARNGATPPERNVPNEYLVQS